MPEFSLNKYLTVKDSELTNRRLKLLKKRNCRFSHDRLKAILEERKAKTSMNQMVFFDKYNDLLVFECKHLKILVQILFAILDYNRQVSHSDDQQFLCFFEPLLKRIAAVTQFQQALRMCLHRKKQAEADLPANQIIKARATFCLQYWWSCLKLKKRLNSLG